MLEIFQLIDDESGIWLWSIYFEPWNSRWFLGRTLTGQRVRCRMWWRWGRKHCQSFSEMFLKFPRNISVSIFPKYFCDFFKVFLSLFSQNISVTVQFQVKALDHPPGTRLKVFQFLMLEIFNPTTDQSYPQCTYIEVDQVGYFWENWTLAVTSAFAPEPRYTLYTVLYTV